MQTAKKSRGAAPTSTPAEWNTPRIRKPQFDSPPPADLTITAPVQRKSARRSKYGDPLVMKTGQLTASGKPSRITKAGCMVTIRLPESWRQEAKEFAEKTGRNLTDVFTSGLAREFRKKGYPLPTDPPMRELIKEGCPLPTDPPIQDADTAAMS